MSGRRPGKRAAAVVLPCRDLDATASFFTERLGFRVDAVSPADSPSVVEISGHGLHLRLQRGAEGPPGVLRLFRDENAPVEAGTLTAPNGTRIELLPADPSLDLPPLVPSFVLTRGSGDGGWHTGRAGMHYRDLIPGRQGGRFIASHIRIPDGGPVADYVHYHRVRFQMIFCHRGSVRVVYEDQGPPFVLEAGDCVLQPPGIRHRVLESSPGLEVIEVSCPAEHETRVDHDLSLPTAGTDPERDFDGQRFVRHVASSGTWTNWWRDGFKARSTGIAEATQGLAAVRAVRPVAEGVSPRKAAHGGEFLFLFVRQGEFELRADGRPEERLCAGDSVVVPAAMPFALTDCSRDLELLEVCLPARLEAG